MSIASVALVALIGWLCGLQTVGVGRDRIARPTPGVLATTAVIGGAAALLVAQQLAGGVAADRADPAAVALTALLGWCVGLQTLRAGRDRSARPSLTVLLTTAALGVATVALVVPHLYRMVT